MNILLYYGGFGLAIFLFLAACVFFFAFRIPRVARYLRSTSRRGLVKAAKVDGTQKEEAARKSAVFLEDGSATLPLDVLAGDTDTINMKSTTAGLTGRMMTPAASTEPVPRAPATGNATEMLTATEILGDDE